VSRFAIVRLLSLIGFLGLGATLHYGFHAGWYLSVMPAFVVFVAVFHGFGRWFSPAELDAFLERVEKLNPVNRVAVTLR
jgi:hypothetical protein